MLDNIFNPKVSIIIPVYNGSNYLKEAIDSALNQTYKNIEIIVVNDGSNDGNKTEIIAKSYKDKIKYFHKKNGGVSSALNAGIKNMVGEYFSWLSHDDIYLPYKIEKQIEFLENQQSKENIVVFCNFDTIDEKSNYIKTIIPELTESENLFFIDLLISWPVHGCGVLFHKSIFDKVGLFNEKNKTVQDYEMWLRIFKKGYEFKYMPLVLFKNRVHQNQDSITTADNYYQEREDTYIYILNILKDNILNLPYEKVEKIVYGLGFRKGLIQASNYALTFRTDYMNTFFQKYFYQNAELLSVQENYNSIERDFNLLKEEYNNLLIKYNNLSNSKAVIISNKLKKYPFFIILARISFICLKKTYHFFKWIGSLFSRNKSYSRK